MRQILFFPLCMLILSCQKPPIIYDEPGTSGNISVYIQSNDIQNLPSALDGNYQLFIYDVQKNKTEFFRVSSAGEHPETFKISLTPGEYWGYCIVNATSDDYIEYDKNKSPENIFLTLPSQNNITPEAKDYLVGINNFSIDESTPSPLIFNLKRKVAMLRITIENIPEWINNLAVHISSIPSRMNLEGEYSRDYKEISKNAEPANNKNTSITSILVFPPEIESYISLSYKIDENKYTTSRQLIKVIKANYITEMNAIFNSSGEPTYINFTIDTIPWNENILHEEDWLVEWPETPDDPTGDGHNLVANNSFEAGMSNAVPLDWKIDKEAADNKITEVTTPVCDGNKAVKLEGKTYLYQDIPVTAGTSYQFKMFVNCPTPNGKWRYWCKWKKGSTDLPSEELNGSYNKQTEGYTDIFRGQVFTAPANATLLRMEIRTYMSDTISGDAIYVDKVSVESIN